MNRPCKRFTLRMLLLPLLAIYAGPAAATHVPVDENGNAIATLDDQAVYAPDTATGVPALGATELEQLVGPIALYPDDLLAIVLPASTYPLQIVQAARFLEAVKEDQTLQPDEDWDESITALLNYPEVLDLMNGDIDWTWQLGEAVTEQQQDVIAAVESFRDRAYAAGNLKSDERQSVTNKGGIIEIVPLDEEIIYVPYYEPQRVLVAQTYPQYSYYDRPRPLYYYPYPAGSRFSSGNFWGVTTAFGINWNSDHLSVFHQSYRGHPYYGRSYYGRNYRRSNIDLYNSYYVPHRSRYLPNRYRDGDYWRPRGHSGSRPGHSRSPERRRHQVSASQRYSAPVRRHGNRAANRGQVRSRDQRRSSSRRTTAAAPRRPATRPAAIAPRRPATRPAAIAPRRPTARPVAVARNDVRRNAPVRRQRASNQAPRSRTAPRQARPATQEARRATNHGSRQRSSKPAASRQQTRKPAASRGSRKQSRQPAASRQQARKPAASRGSRKQSRQPAASRPSGQRREGRSRRH